jgi:tight adherence protein B
MEAILSSRILTAGAAFAAVALAVLALALSWEGLRSFFRRRGLVRQLRVLTKRTEDAKVAQGEGLLRAERNQIPDWLAPFATRFSLSDLAILLEQARSTWSVSTFLMLTAGLALAGGAFGSLLGLGLPFGLVGAGLGSAIPYFMIVRQRAKRFAAFEAGFPEAIDLLARSARAGHAFQSGLREVSEETQDPIKEEFRQVFEEQKFGLPLTESLLGLADRIDLVDVRMFVTSVLIQKETGGNLAENMANLSHVIRERFRFRRQVLTHTAHGRMTGAVLAGTPLVMLFLLNLVSPDYMGVMFTETLGRWMLAGAGLLQLFGFLVIRRMTDIEF